MHKKVISHSYHKGRLGPFIRPDLEPSQYSDQNKNIYITLKDPLGLSPHQILIPQDLFYLVQFFDGRHSTKSLQELFMSQFRRALPVARLSKMIKKLDQSFLLDNERSLAKIDRLRRKYAAQKVRKPICAGSSYPDDPAALETTMQHYLEQAGVEASVLAAVKNKTMKAMIVPHIDPRLGGRVYASAYQALAASAPADVYVILGISHQPTQHIFALTKKDFETPFGVVQTEILFVDKLLEKCDVDYLKDELAHRAEHSIEFQTIFLRKHLGPTVRIVPILASFSHIRSDAEMKQLDDFMHSLKGTAENYPGNICFIASVDFAHVGLMYGSATEPDPYVLSSVEKFDQCVLETLSRRDAIEFERLFKQTDNKYHLCGYPALRTLLGLLPDAESHLIAYDNAIMDDHRSTVTFAGMIFI